MWNEGRRRHEGKGLVLRPDRGAIRWDQVDRIEEYRVDDQAFLSIALRDVDALIEKQPFWKRRIIRANLPMGAAAVNIPQASVSIELSDLRREIEQRRRAAASRSSSC